LWRFYSVSDFQAFFIVNTVDFQGEQIVPSKIVCIGRNYVGHVKELGNELPDSMVVFMKPNSAISRELKSGDGEAHHYEAEICFLCGKGRFVGVSIGIDLTRRELRRNLKRKVFRGSEARHSMVQLYLGVLWLCVPLSDRFHWL
jgi:2-keto-4-pentenoate hydratase/2-oxohepta-3-ene-1,7-dioic acid hydratase in catechol pathway